MLEACLAQEAIENKESEAHDVGAGGIAAPKEVAGRTGSLGSPPGPLLPDVGPRLPARGPRLPARGPRLPAGSPSGEKPEPLSERKAKERLSLQSQVLY